VQVNDKSKRLNGLFYWVGYSNGRCLLLGQQEINSSYSMKFAFVNHLFNFILHPVSHLFYQTLMRL